MRMMGNGGFSNGVSGLIITLLNVAVVLFMIWVIYTLVNWIITK